MLIDFKDIRKSWVFEKKNLRTPVARVIDLVVDCQTFFIPAVWVHTPNGMKIIPTKEIQQWRRKKIVIGDASSLVDVDHYPKLNSIFEREVPVIGSSVFDFNAHQGRCTNFVMETLVPRIMNIEVTKGFLWWKEKRMIPRSKIYKVNDKGILIGDGRIENTEVENID